MLQHGGRGVTCRKPSTNMSTSKQIEKGTYCFDVDHFEIENNGY